MPECAKVYLQQSEISILFQERIPEPPPPLSGEGERAAGKGGLAEGTLAYLPMDHLGHVPFHLRKILHRQKMQNIMCKCAKSFSFFVPHTPYQSLAPCPYRTFDPPAPLQ